jgi:biopolymer transport protein ExbB
MPAAPALFSRAALVFCLFAGALAPVGAQTSTSTVTAPATGSSAPAFTPPGGAAGAVPVLPPIKAPEAAANPYGLRALWAQGDWVARVTLLILAIMSLASWYVLISKLISQGRMGGQGRAANQSFWKADTVRQGAETLEKGSPYRFIAESALEATRKHDGLIGQVDLNTWMAQSIERAISAPSPPSTAAPKRGWRCWRRWAPRRLSSACSARSGASTTRW